MANLMKYSHQGLPERAMDEAVRLPVVFWGNRMFNKLTWTASVKLLLEFNHTIHFFLLIQDMRRPGERSGPDSSPN